MATVLIVEDEDSLRETLSRFLAHEGHEVITAASGYEALEAGFGAAPDVLIADWMLKNHIHGLHVSEVFRALHPKLNTILITGFPSSDLLEASDRCGVLRLLEKPFDLQELQEAVHVAASETAIAGEAGPPIAAMAVDPDGGIEFASDRASELIEDRAADPASFAIGDLIEGDALGLLGEAEVDWVEVRSVTGPEQAWFMRARLREGRPGWVVAFCPRDEKQHRTDPRMRILLDDRRRAASFASEDAGPVVVIERDGVVRRLLVSQIERIGALCYPSDDLRSALRLLSAEPRVRTVMIDCGLAGSEMQSWIDQIQAVCPDATIVGLGAVGAEADLLTQGVGKILRKPWRIQDLIESIGS